MPHRVNKLITYKMKKLISLALFAVMSVAGSAQVSKSDWSSVGGKSGKIVDNTLVTINQLPAIGDSEGKLIGSINVKAVDQLEVTARMSKVNGQTSLAEFCITAKEDVSAPKVMMSFSHEEKNISWWMIPATKYNSIDLIASRPVLAGATFQVPGFYSWQRTNMMTYTEGAEHAVAVWSDEQCASTLAVLKGTGAVHCLVWPDRDIPGSENYMKVEGQNPPTGSRSWEVGGYNFAPKERPMMKKGEKKMLRMYIFTPPVEPNHATMAYALNQVWDMTKAPALPKVNSKKLWKTDIGRVKGQPWTGVGSLAVANALLTDYAQHGNKGARSHGLELADHALGVDWRSLSATEQASMVTGLLRAEGLAAQCGQPREQYKERALEICRHIMDEQYGDGVWGEVGPYYLPALLAAYGVTKDNAYLQAARKGFEPYMKALRENENRWWWGPVERDSAFPLLQAALRLYEHTGEESFLQDAVLASCFLSTWLWQADVDWPVAGLPEGSKCHTFGLSRPSVDCPTFDGEACRWVPEWMELSKLTGDEHWQDRARVIWMASAQIARQTQEVGPVALQLETMLRMNEKGYKL